VTPYPGQTLATPDPLIAQGYNNLANTAVANETLRSAANQPFFTATGGGYGVQSSPAYGGLVDVRSDASRPQQDLIGNTRALTGIGDQAIGVGQAYGGQLGGVAAGVPGTTAPAMGQMGQTVGGYYLNSNPYLDAMYGSAADAVTREYQTATAPRTASSFETAGRYGSPSMMNAQSQNELNLGTSLGNLASNIYGTNYANERALQETAARSMGSLGLSTAQTQADVLNKAGAMNLAGLGQGASANQQAGSLNVADTSNILNALGTMQSGYQSGNAAALQASGMAPQLAQLGVSNAQNMTAAGMGLTQLEQQRLNDEKARYDALQQAPWSNLSNYLNLIGQPTTGSYSKDTPIYGSPTAQTLGMLGATNSLLGNPMGSLLGTTGTSAATGLFGTAGPVFGAANEAAMAGADLIGGAGVLGPGVEAASFTIPELLPMLSIFSDRRLKEDDRVIGHVGRLPLHTFRYKGGDPHTRIGFMADEVAELDPGAVHMTNLGFTAVNYGRALSSAVAAA